MSLIFNWKDVKSRSKAYTYDEVLIVPSKSDVRSRREPDLSTQLTKKISLNLPFISANMDTITEANMAIAMHNEGGFGILHRFISVEEQVEQITKCKEDIIKKKI